MKDAREDNRKTMPDTAELVDKFRAAFGDGVKVLWAQEGDREVGKQTWDGE